MDKRFTDFYSFYNELDGLSRRKTAPSTAQITANSQDGESCTLEPKMMNNGILTMAFVNMQPFESVYSTEDGFTRGTIFPCLDKPLKGGKRK